jgi:hypothetical protein
MHEIGKCSWDIAIFYVLADKYCLPGLKDEIMYVFMAYFQKKSAPSCPPLNRHVYSIKLNYRIKNPR